MFDRKLVVVGGGLAGSEAAWHAAERGIPVTLFESRPSFISEAHVTSDLAEIVCSNSFGSNDPDSAPGQLKSELRELGSIIIQAADRSSVPAGRALAVDRIEFSREITRQISSHPMITLVREEVKEVPDARPVVIATGPLTSPSLAASIGRLTGSEGLFFYDAISPIIDAESIDRSVVFKASRYDRGEGDYLNCPMTEEEYSSFFHHLTNGETVAPKHFEKEAYFEGCMPVEVLARRGYQTLLFGPMKPVGLIDPRNGKRPFAVVQLRAENRFDTCYNMVGFQTKLKYGEQKRIFRLIPGLENAEFLRLGSLHRNTFLRSPLLLSPSLELKTQPGVFIGGQLTGVEGYVESAAMGLLAARNAVRVINGEPPTLPPETTALGALIHYLTNAKAEHFQPMNINFGLFPPLERPVRERESRQRKIIRRAGEEMKRWIHSSGPSKPI